MRSGFEQIPIMSYAVKYASGFYGPFAKPRSLLLNLATGRYQMDPANAREALREAELDYDQGGGQC